ncbi:hypothetical protein ACFL5V_13300, partial [Fibrobacterota bacterium]
MYRTAYSVLLVLFLTRGTYSQLCDSTFTTADGPVSPFNTTALNSYIASLDTNTCGPFVNIDLTFSAASPGETVFLSNEIDISPPNGIITNFNAFAQDDISDVVLSRGVVGPATVLNIGGPNITVSSVGFINLNSGSSVPLVTVEAGMTNVRIQNCQFTMGHAAAIGIEIGGDGVLVEKSDFRGPGSSDSTEMVAGISLTANARNVEIRANLFLNAGMISAADGFHLLANTFVGTIGGSRYVLEHTGNDLRSYKIQHNLLAMENPTTGALNLSSFSGTSDTVMNNATSAASLFTSDFNGLNSNNILLPGGFSNYSAGDYPLVQMRHDLTLSPDDSAFGKLHDVYKSLSIGFSGLVRPLASIPAGVVQFQFFGPFDILAFNTNPDMLVGCFGSFYNSPVALKPSPVSGLSIAVNGITIGKTGVSYDTSYYGGIYLPTAVSYFLSSDSAVLIGEDTTALIAAGNYWNGMKYNSNGISGSNSDTSMAVPINLRTGVPIFIRMVHSTDSGTANFTTQSITRVDTIPVYPSTDFNLTVIPNDVKNRVGSVDLAFTPGVEEIASIRIQAIWDSYNDSVLVDTTFAIQDIGTYIPFTNLRPGQVHFAAWPIGTDARVGANPLVTGTIELWRTPDGAELFVKPTRSCEWFNPGNGSFENPFCDMSVAISSLPDSQTT